ncbi:MAG: polysaccharide lyase, partial [Planctomycetota bacterium]
LPRGSLLALGSLCVIASTCSPAVPPADTPAAQHRLADDFEGVSLASFWQPGDYGAGRYAAGAVAISERFARSGAACVRITVREGDIQQRGSDGEASERAELDSGKHDLLDREVRYRFSFLLPPDFPVVDTRLVIAQWKQDGVAGSPTVAQRFRAGRHYLTIRSPRSGNDRLDIELPRPTPGAWHDMEYVIAFRADDRGSVRVSMDGEILVDHTGPTAFAQGSRRFYHKIGLYRDRWPEPMTIYFDRYEASW